MLSPPVIQINDVEFGYGDGPSLFKDLNLGIDMDSRVCIVGPNGVGKSTLLNLIVAKLEPRCKEGGWVSGYLVGMLWH